MPPWRKFSSATSGSGTNPYSNTANSQSTSRLQEAPTLYLSPVVNLSRSRSSSSPQSPHHGRSLSNPFPSILGINKKVEKAGERPWPSAGTVGSDNDTDFGMSKSLPRTSNHDGAIQYNEADLVAGHCATCNSTVRWPRHLDVYRCTICLMVNDLRPKNPLAMRGSAPVKQTNPSHIPRKLVPLTLERTRNLIDQCILGYLRERAAIPSAVGNNGVNSSQRDSDTLPSLSEHSQTRRKELVPGMSKPLPRLADNKAESTSKIYDHPPLRLAPPPSPQTSNGHIPSASEVKGDPRHNSAKYIFRTLETYLLACLGDCDCLNASFIQGRPTPPARASSEASGVPQSLKKLDHLDAMEDFPFELDAKTLLLGDIGENAMFWTGERHQAQKNGSKDADGGLPVGDRKLPRFNWSAVREWYDTVFSCGRSWRQHWQSLSTEDRDRLLPLAEERHIDEVMTEARYHVQRTFLKATENLLRRPGRPLKQPEDCRFLIILLVNPLLHANQANNGTPPIARPLQDQSKAKDYLEGGKQVINPRGSSSATDSNSRGAATGQHSGLVKRVLGLIGNLPSDCHQHIISWLCRISESQFRDLVELVGGFVSYRIGRQSGRQRSSGNNLTAGLIPLISGPGAGTSAHLHAALGGGSPATAKEHKDTSISYSEDWQIKAAAKVMSLLFAANNSGKFLHPTVGHPELLHRSSGGVVRQRVQRHNQLLPVSAFYNMLLDYADLVADFEAWESRRGKFSFCQYPMFLSIWAKIRILEYDARRQMEVKARDAFFTSILSRKAVSQHLVLKVRRDCLVDDSLRGVSDVVGTGQEEIKKGLRIEFQGEEGVDAGGLRKEWFLLLIREVFDPQHGLFTYDEDSQYCYFNPYSFETSDQFFLVGVVLGLAIYNSTILDVDLPPFLFRKLLAAAPSYTGPSTTAIRPNIAYTLDDLAEWRPSLAKGLRQFLEYEGKVEEVFCRDFVADVERYGQVIQVPLCPNGEKRPVTNSNRREFVDLYIRYMLDTSVARQYEPFKRGFFTVCAGNALSLFRPEEIELLVRGSDEPLDVSSLRAVAVYENWEDSASGQEGQIVSWFWELFIAADVKSQRKMLSFITGSDRIPAMGATSLVIKIGCLGDDHKRYPIARTCFNSLGLYRYRSRAELEARLWRAVFESEGFGLK